MKWIAKLDFLVNLALVIAGLGGVATLIYKYGERIDPVLRPRWISYSEFTLTVTIAALAVALICWIVGNISHNWLTKRRREDRALVEKARLDALAELTTLQLQEEEKRQKVYSAVGVDRCGYLISRPTVS